MLLAGSFHRKALRNMFNPPVIALIFALAINATGLDAHIPQWLAQTVQILAACCVPIVLATTLSSVVTMPLWIHLGLRLVGG